MRNECGTLIGLDWGTSQLRAYLFGKEGQVLDVRQQPWGVLSAQGNSFPDAYRAIVGEWHGATSPTPVIAAGMIGSTEGWVRAPYCACPVGASELAAALVRGPAADDDDGVYVIPGVELRGARPDVMRGEETQVAGALTTRPELGHNATLVLPGTHAKWVEVSAGRIVSFATYLTGELFKLLSDHSILGRLAHNAGGSKRAAETAWEAFDRGVALAQNNGVRGIAPLLFQTRSLVLQNALRADESLDFLSGLLIGDEVHAALPTASATIALLGDRVLCERYSRALLAFGIAAPIIDHSAPAGLWHIASLAGLVSVPHSHV